MLKKIGFVGLGTVGKHMAANLMKGNYRLTVYDGHPEAVSELVKLGAEAAATPMQAAKGQDMVIVILPESDDLKPTLFADKGVLQGIDPGTILVDMGTHSLETT